MNEEYDYIINAFTQSENKTNLEINNLNVECITSTNNKFSLDSDGNLTVKSITAEEGAVSQSAILNYVYPVGAIYMSVTDTNPNVVFGGTWEQIKDKFLLSCGDTYANGATGGNINHTHGLSNGYAMLHLPVDSNYKNLYVNTISTPTWTDTYKVAVNGARVTCSTQNTTGVKLGGNSNSASTLPPYLAVYVWKRTA